MSLEYCPRGRLEDREELWDIADIRDSVRMQIQGLDGCSRDKRRRARYDESRLGAGSFSFPSAFLLLLQLQLVKVALEQFFMLCIVHADRVYLQVNATKSPSQGSIILNFGGPGGAARNTLVGADGMTAEALSMSVVLQPYQSLDV